MRKLISSMPQSKPKNKLLNRIFVITFALIILTGYGVRFYIILTAYGPQPLPPGSFVLEIIFSIIVVGLLVEAWKPSLDFTFHRNRSWIFMSIILFAVFILINVYWWIAHGVPHWQRGWQATIEEYIMGSFAMDTVPGYITSLMFGILFLTKSVPQKSLGYKIMLIGAVLLELMSFLQYISAIAGARLVLETLKNFWGFAIFQPWFWLGLTSEIVITIGAVRLLRRLNVRFIIYSLLIGVFLLPLLFILLWELLVASMCLPEGKDDGERFKLLSPLNGS